MRRTLIAVAAPLMLMLGAGLGGCGAVGNPPASPSTVANATVLDERVALDVELAYKAGRMALETSVRAGLLHGAMASKAAAADSKAYAAVTAVRAAYRAGNATNYLTAAAEARKGVTELLAALK